MNTWEMLVSPFVVVHASGTTRKCTNGIATALPRCRHASACSYSGPAPRLRLLKHPRDIAGTGHHPGRQSPSPVRTSLYLIGHVAGPGNAACVSPARCIHNADHQSASAGWHVYARNCGRFRGTNLEAPLTLSAGLSIAVWHRLRSNSPRSGYPAFRS